MDTQLFDMIRNLPQPLPPHRDAATPNGSIVVYQGLLEIDDAGTKYNQDGTLTFRWLPSPALRFQTELPSFDLQENRITIRIPLEEFEASGFVSSGQGDEVSGVLNGSPWLGRGEPVDSIDFQLSNFHSIVGEPVRTGTDARPGTARLRFALQHPTWNTVVDQVPDYDSRIRQVKTDGGYVVSHTGRITKHSGEAISVEEASQVLKALHFFFSFARGNCTPTFPRGCTAGATIWERVAAWRVGAWKDVGTWFPTQQPSVGGSAWTGFLDRWMDPDLRSPIKLAIHWYIEANTNAGAVEGAVVLAQGALELLAWAVIVDEKHVLTAKEFKTKDYPAAEKIRMLLRELQIPTDIPNELSALRDAATRLKTATDPEIVVRLRNGIVHSNKSKRADIAPIVDRARWQALQYALWCIEMVILRLCDYQGVYSDRLRHKYVGQVDTVPWVP